MTPTDLVLTPRGLLFRGKTFPCSIGRNGVTRHKSEGDEATPVGIHRIVSLLFRPDRLPRPAPWAVAIGPGDLWSDDVRDPRYNRLVRAPHSFSHEHLRRTDPLYDLILVMDWNWPDAKPGRGSAIFIHEWRRPGFPTQGCIALERTSLHAIAKVVIPGTRVIVPEALSRS